MIFMTIKTIQIKCDVPQAEIDLAEKKVAKLDKFFREDTTCEIRFSLSRVRKIAEITLLSSSLVFRAETEASDFISAAEGAIEGIERQIRKNKTRLAKRLRSEAFGKATPDTESSYIPVRRKRFPIEALTVEDAVMQMELLGHSFFLFKNSEDGNLPSVVYKRDDGGYGLIIGE